MANLLQFQNKSQLIASRAKAVLLDIKHQYDRGDIKTESEYIYKLYQGMQSFLNHIGKPTMQVRPANGPPFSGDYNAMLHEIYADLQLLFSETNQIGAALQDSFNQIEVDRQAMSNRLQRIEDSLGKIELKLNQAAQEIIFQDSFIDRQFFDEAMAIDIPANLSTKEGILTLRPVSFNDYLLGASIRILEGNGLPGNTHQIRSLSGQLRFIGEDNLHLNLLEVLDGNTDTWFEYEIFDVPALIQEQVAHVGFNYNEGVKWILEGGKSLKLHIEIELPFAQTINWFSINPFIPNDKGALPCTVTSITVHDGKGKITEVMTDSGLLNEEKVFMFSPHKCKRVIVKLEQNFPYETAIGHLFYKQLEEQNVNFLDRNQEKIGKRINGVSPSVENLGIKFDTIAKSLIYPIAMMDSDTNTELRKQNLFTAPAAPDGYQASFEEITSWRYVIGLRDTGISSYRFEPTSEYCSTSFVSLMPLYSVSLSANAIVPPEFSEGSWLQYFVSIDNGQNWLRIVPSGTMPTVGKSMYIFNSNTPPEGRIPYFGYVDQIDPIYEIRVKILLSRPLSIPGQESAFYTPIVKDYKLHVITREV